MADSEKAPTSDTPKSQTTSAPTKPKKGKSGSHYFKPIASKATSTQANRTIILAVGAGVGVILIARISGTPGTKQLNNPGSLIKVGVGTGATVITLMIVAEIAPDVAIGLAWLIFVGALLTYGVPFGQALIKGTLRPSTLPPITKGQATLSPDSPKGKSAPPNSGGNNYNPFNPFLGGGIIS